MGLIDGLIKGHLARKARRKLGSWGPLVAGALMLTAFVAQALGEVATSDVLLQTYRWLGVESPIPAQTLVELRDALEALAPSVYAWLAPITGVGAAYKLGQKRKDAQHRLSKPAVLSESDEAFLSDADPQAARFLAVWRHLLNVEGLPATAAFRTARREVYGR